MSPAQGDLFAPPTTPKAGALCQRVGCGHAFLCHHDGSDLLLGTCCASCGCAGFIGADDIEAPRKRPVTISEGAYRDAYERGIRRAAPQPFAVVGTRLGAILGTVARAHAIEGGRPITGPALLTWIEDAACAFRIATANEPQYWSGWQPFAFAKWQNMRVAAVAKPEAPTRLQPLAPRRPPRNRP